MSPAADASRPASILLVEDDEELRTSLAASLSGRFRIEAVGDGVSALRRWAAARPDVIILDLGLPDLDGLSVISRVRAEAATPILVLTARDREGDKVEALERGADDYVTKPFGMAELRARLGALLRRAMGPAAGADGVVWVGPLSLDVAHHSVAVAGIPVRLTPREFEVLKVLVSHAGRIVTHGRLLRAVWGTSYGDEAHYLHVYVSAIRRKLAAADPAGRLGAIIVSEPGVGYRVSALEPGADDT